MADVQGYRLDDGMLDDAAIDWIAKRLKEHEAVSDDHPTFPAISAMSVGDEDIRDAQDVLATLKTLTSLHRDVNDSRVNLLMRQAVDNLWDASRKTVQGQRKYCHRAVWSPDAADQAAGGNYKDLVDEHVVPFAEILSEILARIDTITPEELIEVLERYPRAVITRSEADRVDKVSGRFSMPDARWRSVPGGEWGRYVKAGLDPSQFRVYVPTLCGALDATRRDTVGTCHKVVGHNGKHTGANVETGRNTSWS